MQRKCSVRQSPTDFHDPSRHFPSTGNALTREHIRNAAFCSQREISAVTMLQVWYFCILSPSKGGLSKRRVGNAMSPSLSWSYIWSNESLSTPCRKIGLNFPSILQDYISPLSVPKLQFFCVMWL